MVIWWCNHNFLPILLCYTFRTEFYFFFFAARWYCLASSFGLAVCVDFLDCPRSYTTKANTNTNNISHPSVRSEEFHVEIFAMDERHTDSFLPIRSEPQDNKNAMHRPSTE